MAVTKFQLAAFWLALIVVQLGFGANPVLVIKFARNHKADPLMFCVIKDGGVFPVLFLAALVAEKKIDISKMEVSLFENFLSTGALLALSTLTFTGFEFHIDPKTWNFGWI